MRRTNSALALMAMAALAGGVGASVASGPSVQSLRTHEGPPLIHDSRTRGKGRNKHPHSLGGTRAHQRLALKKRNQARHRKACR